MNRVTNINVPALALILSVWLAGTSRAAPFLALQTSGGSATATVDEETPALVLNLKFNSDGNPISGLSLYLQSDGSNPVTYATPSVTTLGPFVSNTFVDEILERPAAGNALDASSPTTFYRTSSGDYAAFNGAIATYAIDTSRLAVGEYTFSPIGTEMTFTNNSITTFATPDTFKLVVAPVPEPASIGLLLLLAGGPFMRRGVRN